MGQAARQRVLQHFTLEDMARRYQDLYDEVLSSPSPQNGAPIGARSPSAAVRREISRAAAPEARVGAGRESYPSE